MEEKEEIKLWRVGVIIYVLPLVNEEPVRNARF